MSKGEKAGIVAQDFCVQLRDRIHLEQFSFDFFITAV
jgi:hypothetical protein